jgi:hypothetical protein
VLILSTRSLTSSRRFRKASGVSVSTSEARSLRIKSHSAALDENKDPYKVTNCLPIAKFELKEYKPYIDELRAKIREAKQGHSIPSLPHPTGQGLASELEKLASLRTSGVLTDEEFQRAKQRLLD